MAATTLISQPGPLEKAGDLAENWRKWKQNFEIYLIASGTDQKGDRVICANFLHIIGQHGLDIYNDLELSQEEVNTLEDLYTRFEKYCNPKTNITFSRYQFFNTKQEKKQAFDAFLLSLKQRSKNCDFGDLNNSLIMTQIISGISNTRLRERLLRIEELDLNRTIEECRTTESSETQAREIAAAAAATNTPKPKKNKAQQPGAAPAAKAPEKKPHKNQKSDGASTGAVKKGTEEGGPPVVRMLNCKFCGGTHVYGNCPAFGKTCTKCEKPNHFSKVCRN